MSVLPTVFMKSVIGLSKTIVIALVLSLSVLHGQSIQNGPSKICGRQPLNSFTWFILEYLAPYDYAETCCILLRTYWTCRIWFEKERDKSWNDVGNQRGVFSFYENRS